MTTSLDTTDTSAPVGPIQERDDTNGRELGREFLTALGNIGCEANNTTAKRYDCSASFDEPWAEERTDARNEDVRCRRSSVPADLAAVAVLVARAIEAEEGLLEKLRGGAPIVVIATHSAQLVEPVRKIFADCVMGREVGLLELKTDRMRRLKAGCAGIVVRDGLQKSDVPEYGNNLIVEALHVRVPLIGIAPDPVRHLPRELLRSAEYRVAIPALDRSAVELVVEEIFGQQATCSLDDELLRTIEIVDFAIALRNVSSAGEAIEAIGRVLEQKSKDADTSPALEAMHGYGEAKRWGLTLVADLQEFRAGRLDWHEIDSRSVLLSGPPGTGKSLFARALAKSAKVPLIRTSVAHWSSQSYLSGTLQAIGEIFAEAKAAAPCVLFIDELDGISDRSKISGDHSQYWVQIVNCLLEQLSSPDDRPGVIVVAATNLPERIDPAIKRSGRLDREIAIPEPHVSSLVEIFRYHLRPCTFTDASLMRLALAARGRTGADVEAYVRRARGVSRRAGRDPTIEDVLREARSGRVELTATVKRRIAIHEAGHAVVSRALDVGLIVDISLHDTGGEMLLKPRIDGTTTLNHLEALLAALMAGRVAEEIAFGSGSIGMGFGQGSDLAQASSIARDIEFRFGLGVLGPIYVEISPRDIILMPGGLEAVTARLRKAQSTARGAIETHWDRLLSVADALEQAAYLSGSEVDSILQLSAI
jgi:ATP-dependent Zn protease